MIKTGTYLKAMFLLVVFCMNALVSFACSFGGFFHSLHHQNPSSNITAKASDHHSSTTDHHHDTGNQHEHNADHPEKGDDCCSDKMSEVEKVDKSVSRTIEAPKIIFLTSFTACFTSFDSRLESTKESVIPDLVRWRILATIPDLRIAIQSFQI